MKSLLVGIIFLATSLFLNQTAFAAHMLMARTPQSFPEAMLKLQEVIRNKGYVVSRVQRVDIGLTSSGYQTDKYRVVFYGVPEEIARLSKKYPALISYLPLKISIFAEGKDTILVTANPQHLKKAGDAALARAINKWERDLVDIFAEMREEE